MCVKININKYICTVIHLVLHLNLLLQVTTPSLGGTACSVPDSFLYLWNHVCVPCEHDVSFWIRYVIHESLLTQTFSLNDRWRGRVGGRFVPLCQCANWNIWSSANLPSPLDELLSTQWIHCNRHPQMWHRVLCGDCLLYVPILYGYDHPRHAKRIVQTRNKHTMAETKKQKKIINRGVC